MTQISEEYIAGHKTTIVLESNYMQIVSLTWKHIVIYPTSVLYWINNLVLEQYFYETFRALTPTYTS